MLLRALAVCSLALDGQMWLEGQMAGRVPPLTTPPGRLRAAEVVPVDVSNL